jgi:hypothetical protein
LEEKKSHSEQSFAQQPNTQYHFKVVVVGSSPAVGTNNNADIAQLDRARKSKKRNLIRFQTANRLISDSLVRFQLFPLNGENAQW